MDLTGLKKTIGFELVPYRNHKNGHIYFRMIPFGAEETVRDCTNERDGTLSVLYVRDGAWYVREEKEFNTKFTRIDSTEEASIRDVCSTLDKLGGTVVEWLKD